MSIIDARTLVVIDDEMKPLIDAISREMKGIVDVFEQNDAHEFFVILLERLATEIGKPMPPIPPNNHLFISHTHDIIAAQCDKAWAVSFGREFSFINSTFFGQTVQQVKCGGCGKCHHNYDVFSVLEVPVCDDPTVNASIAAAFADEVVNPIGDVGPKWTCDACNESHPSTKVTQLWKTPEILVICAKRFSYSKDLRPSKDSRPVNFPASINLGQHSIGHSVRDTYTLAGIVNHFGHMGRGHYTAYAFPSLSGAYSHIDDDIVTQCVHKPDPHAAYMAFYVATAA
jgi:ubiquitin C-terminal hydrolase